jgi:hypothetical protein
MQKIETIWHHLLWEALKKSQFRHTQKSLADYFGYSLSTVNLAVRAVEEIGAVKLSGKFFTVKDVKKLLYYWATHRRLSKDVIYQTFVDESILEIEGLVPAGAIFAGYRAAKEILGEALSDYSKVYIYFDETNLNIIKKRFPQNKSNPNLFVLRSYPKQSEYNQITTLPQTFVDLWNLNDWYAKDYLIGLEGKIDGLLP